MLVRQSFYTFIGFQGRSDTVILVKKKTGKQLFCSDGLTKIVKYHTSRNMSILPINFILSNITNKQLFTFVPLCLFEGWASDRKTVPLEIVRRRILRAGDGTHRFAKEKDQEHLWGWGDKDMLLDESEYAEIVNSR